MVWALALWGCGSPPPNVLLVTLDTVRVDAIGAYAPGRPSVTPRLDALSAEGIRFDRAYTVTPLTIPAHASIHTGLLPPRHGIRDNGDARLPERAVTLAERLSEAGWATMASVGAEVTSRRWGFAQGFGTFDDPRPTGVDRWRLERPAEEVAARAARFVAERPPGQPWFVWVHLYDAHAPYDPPAPWPDGDPYRGEIARIDRAIGALLQGAPLERTWVFVVADHGEALGEHGEDTHGLLLYDPTVRIPWIVRPPGGAPEPRVVDAPVSLVDLYPTVLALVGLPIGEVDGFDLSRTLRGGWAPGADRGLYLESLYGTRHFGWAPQRAWVDGTHKWIGSATPELYRRADRGEREDLAGSEPALGRRMEAELEAYSATLTPAFGREVPGEQERQALLALGYLQSEARADGGALPDPRPEVLRELERCRRQTERGEWLLSRSCLERILAVEPSLSDPRLMLARVEEQLGDSDRAIRILDRLLAEDRTARVLGDRGAIHARRGEPDLALPLLEEALALDPYDGLAWSALLGATFGTPRFSPALAEALDLLPEDPQIRGFEALSQAIRGDPEAAGPLRAALALGPRPLFQLGLGLAERSLGRDLAAEDALLEEIRLFPPALLARRALAALYAEQRRYDEQLAELDAIAALEEPSAETLNARAQALFNLGRYPEAQREVEACLWLDPRRAACELLAANVCSRLGRPEDAQRAYRRALDLDGQQ